MEQTEVNPFLEGFSFLVPLCVGPKLTQNQVQANSEWAQSDSCAQRNQGNNSTFRKKAIKDSLEKFDQNLTIKEGRSHQPWSIFQILLLAY